MKNTIYYLIKLNQDNSMLRKILKHKISQTFSSCKQTLFDGISLFWLI